MPVATDVLYLKGYANESYFKKGVFGCLRTHHFPGFLVSGLLIPPSSGAATDLGLRASLIQQHTPPEILIHGLVTPADVEKLFSMYVWATARLEGSMPSNITDR